ncbi:alkaline phosphatase family protein [Halorussus sp. MSC15.2]|uniref:alkaline phosphatase family protein n=1 Tax=Halorussus sp. MSC15.2 TaxID=2283638 RepID=UPI00196879DF
MSSNHNTVVLGFDALDFNYLDAFESSLPNFASLRESGVEAPLESTFPPWTGSAWPSMYTGTDPSHHGTYGFFHHTDGYPSDDVLVTRDHVREPAIWNYLTAISEPVVVLNVPVTHPAEPVEGVLVPGYLAHEEDAGYPEGVRDELSEAIGEEYRIYSEAETSEDCDDKEGSSLDLIRMRGEAAEYLLTEYDWRVAVVQVQKTDTVFHDFDDREAFRRAYERADEVLGRVRAAADDANVVVCSDHGMGRVDGYTVYVNEILRNAGFVETTTDSSGPSLMTEKATLTGTASDSDGSAAASGGGPSVTGQVVSAATATLDRVGVSPGDAYALATRLGLGGVPLERSLLRGGVGRQRGRGLGRIDGLLPEHRTRGAGESGGPRTRGRRHARGVRAGPRRPDSDALGPPHARRRPRLRVGQTARGGVRRSLRGVRLRRAVHASRHEPRPQHEPHRTGVRAGERPRPQARRGVPRRGSGVRGRQRRVRPRPPLAHRRGPDSDGCRGSRRARPDDRRGARGPALGVGRAGRLRRGPLRQRRLAGRRPGRRRVGRGASERPRLHLSGPRLLASLRSSRAGAIAVPCGLQLLKQ